MSIEDLERFADYEVKEFYLNCVTHKIVNILKDQSDQIADLRQELAKKEDTIDISDVIKEARLRNG